MNEFRHSSHTSTPSGSILTRLLESLELCDPVSYVSGCGNAGAFGTTEEVSPHFNTMSDHLAFAMFANGRHRMDCAFETVERVPCSRRFDCKSLVIFVPADFALCH